MQVSKAACAAYLALLCLSPAPAALPSTLLPELAAPAHIAAFALASFITTRLLGCPGYTHRGHDREAAARAEELPLIGRRRLALPGLSALDAWKQRRQDASGEWFERNKEDIGRGESVLPLSPGLYRAAWGPSLPHLHVPAG